MKNIMKGLNILVLEDDKYISEFLHEFLSDYFANVFVYTDNRFNYSKLEHIDIFLLDVEIPFDNGYEICKRIKLLFPQKPVVFLTAHSQLEDKIKGLELGEDFIPKPFEPLELIARLENLLSNKYSEYFYLSGLLVNKVKHSVLNSKTKQEIKLSNTEKKLFFYLYNNIDLCLSKEQIIEHIWGIDYNGKANSLNVYINNLRNKVDSNGEIIHTIYGYGYKMSTH
ncbi:MULTISPECIES: response regulator transcription factor [Clostridia]|uniref:response regulator transcription factor n=1 Tax=Clostridia TaxID=186801 RepID=UPI000EA09494|nr:MULTISPECIES: response regulator transcription factor [Clostridia]NBJ69539.1 DNA-binding response regulator [Roseburia sp. 1XD42-34]RKI78611.1 DNA-binding response regulator [Clostridium sp. 1xD42-85]